MCDTCGCGLPEEAKNRQQLESISVMRGLMDSNNHQASHNRSHFERHEVLTINLMSSPGAGKTRLLEATIDAIGSDCRIMVIEGDLETENDASRIRARGVPAIQITTGSACHLDARQIHQVLHDAPLADIDILFIENVGNLVCPASFDLGQHLNVVLLSVTEGDDKPLKYPVMFRAADLVLLSKCDLLEVLDDFDCLRAREAVDRLGRKIPVVEVAAGRHTDIVSWLDWLKGALAERSRINTLSGSI